MSHSKRDVPRCHASLDSFCQMCRFIAQGKSNKLIRPHEVYTDLGSVKASRCEAYKALFKEHLEEGELQEIRAACLE